jgi:hypothetical protein
LSIALLLSTSDKHVRWVQGPLVAVAEGMRKLRTKSSGEMMSYSLYTAVVPPYIKMLENLGRLLSKAEAHCAEAGLDEVEILDARLAPDMLPFAYQIKSTVVHSIGAIEGVRRGSFSPDMTPPDDSFSALSDCIETARSALAALEPVKIDAFVGCPMQFVIKAYHADFTAEEFLLTFSVPNFYFHATTAYDILRYKGLAIGKVDYLGRLSLAK